MCNYLNTWLDSRLFGLVTRPLAALIVASMAFGLAGFVGGLVYDVFHNSSGHAIVVGFRLASAGAAAGLVAGLLNALDRLTWPEDNPAGMEEPTLLLPRSKDGARYPVIKLRRGIWTSPPEHRAPARK
jgi:hypothetical protein